jgi:hypothetical protein
MKICPVGADLFPTDGWTDTLQPIVTFHNFGSEIDIANEKVI